MFFYYIDRTSLISILIILTTNISFGDTPENSSDATSLEIALRELRESRSKIRGIRYTASVEGYIKDLNSSGSQHFKRIYYAAKDQRFREKITPQESQRWGVNIRCNSSVYQGGILYIINPLERHLLISKKGADVSTNPKFSSLIDDLYFWHMHWWPQDSNWDPSRGHSLLLDSKTAGRNSKLEVKQTSNTLTFTLRFLNSNNERILQFDRKRGLALLSETSLTNYENIGLQKIKIDNLKFLELEDNIWVPITCRRVVTIESDGNKSTEVSRSQMVLEEVKLLESPLDLAPKTDQEGWIIFNDDTKEIKVMPGGRDLLKKQINRIKSR